MLKVKLNENVSRRELRRLGSIQKRLSKKINVSTKQVQANAYNYFPNKGRKTFSNLSDPSSGDGLYGEEMFSAIILLQGDLVKKGFMAPVKPSEKLSTEGLYGPITHAAFLKAANINALRGFVEPEDQDGIEKRILQLENFIEKDAENDKQKKWAQSVIELLRKRLNILKPKEPEKVDKQKSQKLAKDVAQKAADRGEILDVQVEDWAEWFMYQQAAGNIEADYVEGRWKTKGDPAPITKAYLAKKRSLKQAARDMLRQDLGKKPIPQSHQVNESKIYESFSHYFEQNKENLLILTENNYNSPELFKKAMKIFNFGEKI